MSWTDDVRLRLKRGNQILFTQDCKFLRKLTELVKMQNHRTMVLWALDFATQINDVLTAKYPHEKRLATALLKARLWAKGEIKMREAQRAILDAHAFAKEIVDAHDIALCHALGQACGVVHTCGHAMGLPMYELTAIVVARGFENCKAPVEARMQQYIDRLLYWAQNYDDSSYEWADFMLT